MATASFCPLMGIFLCMYMSCVSNLCPSLLFLYICVGVWCVHLFICVHIYIQLHVHVEIRGWFSVSSLTTLQFALLYFILLRWDLSLLLELIHSARLTAQWYEEAAYISYPKYCGHRCMPLCLVFLWCCGSELRLGWAPVLVTCSI